MRNLLNFLLRYSSTLLLVVYLVISSSLLFTANPWQHHVYLTSAGKFASSVYEVSSSVSGYFGLKSINEDLQRKNTALEKEVLRLQALVNNYSLMIEADTLKVDSVMQRYSFVPAHVIHNSIARPNNYITIDRGSLDGIKPEMGVMDQNGIVGVVNVTGPHSARVISLLNPYLKLSCKVKGAQHIGSLSWDGKNYREAVLDELPKHAKFHKGDTIVTSGYSSTFPEGVGVGVIVGTAKVHDDNFRALRVRLFTDFSTLSTVRVVRDAMQAELRALEATDTLQPTQNPGN